MLLKQLERSEIDTILDKYPIFKKGLLHVVQPADEAESENSSDSLNSENDDIIEEEM